MSVMIYTARKDIFVHCATAAFKPCQQAGSGVRQQFELNRPTCLLLHHDYARSDLPTAHKITDFHPHQIAATQFAVDREIEKRTISQAAALIEVESDLPYLL